MATLVGLQKTEGLSIVLLEFGLVGRTVDAAGGTWELSWELPSSSWGLGWEGRWWDMRDLHHPLGVWGEKDDEWYMRGLHHLLGGLGWEGRWMDQRLTIILLVTVTLHSHSKSLTVRHYSMKVRLRMEITQSWDCTRVLCNLEIGCTLSRLEHNLRILRMCNIISKMRRTYTMYTSKRQPNKVQCYPNYACVISNYALWACYMWHSYPVFVIWDAILDITR